MARSNDKTERIVGLRALAHLGLESTPREYELIAAVVDAYSDEERPSADCVDKEEPAGNNENEGGDQL